MTRQENAISAIFFGTLSITCGLISIFTGILFFAGLSIGFGIGALIDGASAALMK